MLTVTWDRDLKQENKYILCPSVRPLSCPPEACGLTNTQVVHMMTTATCVSLLAQYTHMNMYSILKITCKNYTLCSLYLSCIKCAYTTVSCIMYNNMQIHVHIIITVYMLTSLRKV